MKNDPQPVDIQWHHQQVLDGKEDQHLVDDAKMDHDCQANNKEWAILNEEGFHHSPKVRPVFGEESVTLTFTLIICFRINHCGQTMDKVQKQLKKLNKKQSTKS